MPARVVILTAIIASCVSAAVTLAVALLVLPPVIGAAPDPQAAPPLVRAERFELVDPQGKVLAVLGKRPPDPAAVIPRLATTELAFLDQAGQPRASIGLYDNMLSDLTLWDDYGHGLHLGGFTDPSGAPRAGLGLNMGSRPREGVMVDTVSVSLVLLPNSNFLMFTDANGQYRAGIGIRPDGTPWTEPSGVGIQQPGEGPSAWPEELRRHEDYVVLAVPDGHPDAGRRGVRPGQRTVP